MALRKIGVIRFYSSQSQLWGQLLPEPEHPVTLSEQEIICFCITFCTPNLCNLEVLLCINFSVLIDTSVVADTDGFIDANAAVVADPDANADAVTDADPDSHADADADPDSDADAGADSDADLLPFFLAQLAKLHCHLVQKIMVQLNQRVQARIPTLSPWGIHYPDAAHLTFWKISFRRPAWGFLPVECPSGGRGAPHKSKEMQSVKLSLGVSSVLYCS